jgi:hypothetical protein
LESVISDQWRRCVKKFPARAPRYNLMTNNLDVDSKRCTANTLCAPRNDRPKSRMAYGFASTRSLRLIGRVLFFLCFKVSREISRGIVFKLIEDENNTGVSALNCAVQVVPKSLSRGVLLLTFDDLPRR